MLALPPAPAPAPKRQVLIGTALAGGVIATMFFSMLGVWLKFRAAAPLNDDLEKAWLPKKVVIPEVPANMMLITLTVACLFAQYAVYSSKRQDRPNVIIALGLTIVMGIAIINAQAVIWGRMGMGIADGTYQTMFFTITGAFVALVVIGIVWSTVALFRCAGGRAGDTELASAHALYWYVITAVFTFVWLVIYVQK